MKSFLAMLLFSAGLMVLPLQASAQDTAAPDAPVATEQAPAETEQSPAAVESPVEAMLEAFLVQVTQKDDGARVETLVPAATAVPGDIIEYQATYTNVSANALIGLVSNGPIPTSTTYVDASATITQEAVFEVLIKDEDWQALPAFKSVTDENGKVVRVEASAADYTELRWRISGTLEPEQKLVARYRVKVNN